MKLELGPEVILSYKRLNYQPWFALAEFVDNSTQAYFNNKSVLDKAFKKENTGLKIIITTGKDAHGKFVRIEDNSMGMSEAELENAVCIGRPPVNTLGRSKYGLGLKTGASWFGDLWSIETKRLNESHRHKIDVDVEKVAKNQLSLPHKKTPAPVDDHGTTIEIRKLHRELTPRALAKVKDFLRSLYRHDINEGGLNLILNGSKLSWEEDWNSKLVKCQDGSLARKNFKFKIGKKVVSGWAGVLEKGSRRWAGFSILQNKRVIQGWPDNYKPETIFGEQSGGSNTLVNQRLFGEITLDGFEVSHTKDRILFEDGEQDELDDKLDQELAALTKIAKSFRAKDNQPAPAASEAAQNEALNVIEEEISSNDAKDMLRSMELPPPRLQKQVKVSLIDAVVARHCPKLTATLNKLDVKLYLVDDLSPNDPYVLIESIDVKQGVIVIINRAHPHWSELTEAQAVLTFIKHCVYDGVAEAKAYEMTKKMEPDTVKLIKDNLLRLRFKMA